MENIIQTKKLIKTYSNGNVDTHVLKGIDLEVKKGEWLAIMGKSGAGKSTLMYQISLLDVPTSGEIKVEGKNVDSMSDDERTHFRLTELGYVFQDYALLPELDVVENVIVPLLMQGMDMKEARGLAIKALERIGLDKRLDHRPSQLSGGEQQRVSVARATTQNPKILFADEPTANLDSVASDSVIEIMRDLHKGGQTIVMVTHEEEYTKYCDRIIYLDDGLIVKEEKK